MIKSYSVRYEDKAKKTIDTHLRIEPEIIIKAIPRFDTAGGNQGFVEGIKAIPIEKIPSDEELKEKSGQILTDAQDEAKRIIDEAIAEAEKIKNDTYQAAQKKGYEDGLQQSNREIQKQKMDLEGNAKKLQEQYDTMVSELEPKMVEIMSHLIEKVTGILVEDKEEVLLYLIDNALKNRSKSNEYTIRISKDDYEYVTSKKNVLQNCIGDANLNIMEDSTLTKNQCLLEMEQCVIDCSLDVQLNNLINDLRLLGGI